MGLSEDWELQQNGWLPFGGPLALLKSHGFFRDIQHHRQLQAVSRGLPPRMHRPAFSRSLHAARPPASPPRARGRAAGGWGGGGNNKYNKQEGHLQSFTIRYVLQSSPFFPGIIISRNLRKPKKYGRVRIRAFFPFFFFFFSSCGLF